jgi:RNase P subunit RPR2
MSETLCPRCNKTMQPPRVALSRLTRGEQDVPLYVCPQCGLDEAIEQFANNGVAVDWRKEK